MIRLERVFPLFERWSVGPDCCLEAMGPNEKYLNRAFLSPRVCHSTKVPL